MRPPRVRYTVRGMMALVATVAVGLTVFMAMRSRPPQVRIINDTGHPLYDAILSCNESREEWVFGLIEPGVEIRCQPHAPHGAFAVLTYSPTPRGHRVKHLIRLGGHASIHLQGPGRHPSSGRLLDHSARA